MSVDLGTGSSGIVKIDDDRTYFCPRVSDNRDGTFTVRLAPGVYRVFDRSGKSQPSIMAQFKHVKAIVDFFPCEADHELAKGMPDQLKP